MLSNGRINIAGLSLKEVPYFVESVKQVLTKKKNITTIKHFYI
jgi:hypothetical protein